VLIQPELVPEAGGTARIVGAEVHATGVRGHPGALLSGWADAAAARVRREGAGSGSAGSELGRLVGEATVTRVAEVAWAVHEALGDDVIEWASADGEIMLLQSSRSRSPAPAVTERALRAGAEAANELLRAFDQGGANRGGDRWAPSAALALLAHGSRLAGTICVPGEAFGRLRYVRPHEPASAQPGQILVCDRPVPALAPLLFGAQAVVTLAGPADSHLAGVARSLGVPMLVRVALEQVTGPVDRINANGWLATVDAVRGELAVARSPVTREPPTTSGHTRGRR
jgi:phosphohistidine swiveling domain-containing protein